MTAACILGPRALSCVAAKCAQFSCGSNAPVCAAIGARGAAPHYVCSAVAAIRATPAAPSLTSSMPPFVFHSLFYVSFRGHGKGLRYGHSLLTEMAGQTAGGSTSVTQGVRRSVWDPETSR